MTEQHGALDAGMLPSIPPPRSHGKRQLICPERDCNRRFTSLTRYDLHWRVSHGMTRKPNQEN